MTELESRALKAGVEVYTDATRDGHRAFGMVLSVHDDRVVVDWGVGQIATVRHEEMTAIHRVSRSDA